MSETGFIERGIAPVLVDAMGSARAVALLGARQAGKSTLARALAAGPVPADYLTLDDGPVRAAARADPDGLVARLGRRTVIDEVQRTPDLCWRSRRGLTGTARPASSCSPGRRTFAVFPRSRTPSRDESTT